MIALNLTEPQPDCPVCDDCEYVTRRVSEHVVFTDPCPQCARQNNMCDNKVASLDRLS
jgi:hypothetical protein